MSYSVNVMLRLQLQRLSLRIRVVGDRKLGQLVEAHRDAWEGRLLCGLHSRRIADENGILQIPGLSALNIGIALVLESP